MSGNWDALTRIIRRHLPSSADGESDTTLLARFLMDGDETAFEELVRRYGALVYSVCRRGLPSPDADDAFQATFLSLVARVRKVGPIEGVGGWLYRAATHVVADFRRGQRRRHAREFAAARPEAAPNAPSVDDDELLSVLDEEIAGLPDRHRQAIVHYHVLNQPLAKLAAVLGVSVTIAWKRVHQAEAMLRQRLMRRGVAVPAVGLFSALAIGRDATAAPASIIHAVVRSISTTSANANAELAPVAFATKTPPYRLIGMIAVGILIGAACGAVLWEWTRRNQEPSRAQPVVASSPVTAQPNPALPEQPVPWTVLTGCVIDADGKAVPHARLAVLGRPWDHVGAGRRDELLADCTAEADGRFRLPVLAPPRGGNEGIWLVTFDPKRGRTITKISDRASVNPAELTIRLTGAGFSGRVVDPNGKPLAGANVHVARFGDAGFEPILPKHKLPSDVWPEPVITDADGRFAFPTLDPRVGLRLSATHTPTRMSGVLEILESKQLPKSDIVVRLETTRRLNGRVIAGDTGLPLAAEIAVEIQPDDPSGKVQVARVWAGKDGLFTVAVPNRPLWRLYVTATGFPRAYQWVEPDAGAEPVETTVAMPVGVAVTGRITDAETGRPIPLAKVRYHSQTPIIPPPKGKTEAWPITGDLTGIAADSNGRFKIVVPSIPGMLTATAPGSDYLSTELDPETTEGKVVSVHAIIPLSVPHDGGDTAIRLEKGRTIRGRITLPDGTAVSEGSGYCVHLIGDRGLPALRRLSFHGGRLTIPGCHSKRTYTLIMTDRRNQHGAVTRVEWSEKPVAISLQPLGTADIEVRSSNDSVARKVPFTLDLGIPLDAADAAEQGGVRWQRLLAGVTDDKGHAMLKGLIPGARYRVVAGPANKSGVTVVTVQVGKRSSATVVLPEPEDD